MGNVQPSKLVDSNAVGNLSFHEDGEIRMAEVSPGRWDDSFGFFLAGQFAKIYKGNFGGQAVSIKVPRVPDHIRKDKSRKLRLFRR